MDDDLLFQGFLLACILTLYIDRMAIGKAINEFISRNIVGIYFESRDCTGSVFHLCQKSL